MRDAEISDFGRHMKRFDLNGLKRIVEDDQRVYLESGNPVSYNDPEEGRRLVREYQSGRGVIQKAKKREAIVDTASAQKTSSGF